MNKKEIYEEERERLIDGINALFKRYADDKRALEETLVHLTERSDLCLVYIHILDKLDMDNEESFDTIDMIHDKLAVMKKW